MHEASTKPTRPRRRRRHRWSAVKSFSGYFIPVDSNGLGGMLGSHQTQWRFQDPRCRSRSSKTATQCPEFEFQGALSKQSSQMAFLTSYVELFCTHTVVFRCPSKYGRIAHKTFASSSRVMDLSSPMALGSRQLNEPTTRRHTEQRTKGAD